MGGRRIGRAYGVGEIGPDPRRTAFFIVCGVVVVAFLSFIIYSVIVVPGVLLIWAVYVAIERSSCVVVTDEQVAVLARSEFSGRPRRFIGWLPREVLTAANVYRSGGYVHLPTLHLWLRKKEYDLLVSVPAVPEGLPTMQMAPQGPVQSDRFAPSAVASAPSLTATRRQSVQGPAVRSAKSGYPPPPRGPVEAGWRTVGTKVNEQWYWNGEEWTGHRRWRERRWVEEP